VTQTLASDPQSVFPEGDAPEQVTEDIWRIPLPLPLALRSVNVYLIDDGAGNRFLVDAGLGLPADEDALRAGLEQAGAALEDISALVLTHAHPDHIGLSATIQAASGGPVYLLEGEDDRLYGVWSAVAEATLARVDAMYAANGLPEPLSEGAASATRKLRRILRLAPREAVQTLADEKQLRLGSHSYRVLWTPGHSDYHLCLLRDDGVFFAGDHILPAITPNIGLYPQSRPNPLQDYLASLDRVAPLPARLVLPGHGRPFADLAARAAALRTHHQERSATIRTLLAASPNGIDAAAIAGKLFAGRLNTPDDWRFALAETLAHLEYLRADGLTQRHERDGIFRYVLSPDITSPLPVESVLDTDRSS
jgi:glyoxylase-like metal-dependent hydrolase (beta-lactamase superfamily II)